MQGTTDAPLEKYLHPFDCPFFLASWCDRVVVRPAPAWANVFGPCWVWTGWNNGKPSGPYGKVKIAGRCLYLHRVMWERHHGVSLAGGEVLDHLCRVRLCFNPYHLECTDYAGNRATAIAYANSFGNNDNALTEEDLAALRGEYYPGR